MSRESRTAKLRCLPLLSSCTNSRPRRSTCRCDVRAETPLARSKTSVDQHIQRSDSECNRVSFTHRLSCTLYIHYTYVITLRWTSILTARPKKNLRGPRVARQQQLLIDICCPRPTPAANPPSAAAEVDRWDRRTDGHLTVL